LNQQATSTATGMSKGDSQTPPRAPDDATALFGAAEQQLETGRHLGLPRDLEARAARRIIDNPAIDDGGPGGNDQLARV